MTAAVNFGPSKIFNQTVTRLRALQRTNSNGLPVVQRDWSTPDELTIIGVSVQPLSSKEIRANDRRNVTSDYVLISPPLRGDVDIQRGDRIMSGTLTLEVQGEPERWPAVTGGIDHVEVLLQVSPPWAGAGGDTTDGQLQSGASGAAAGWSLQ